MFKLGQIDRKMDICLNKYSWHMAPGLQLCIMCYIIWIQTSTAFSFEQSLSYF